MTLAYLETLESEGGDWSGLVEAFRTARPGTPYATEARQLIDYLLGDGAAAPEIDIAAVDKPIHDLLPELRRLVDWQTLRVRSSEKRQIIKSPFSDEVLLKASVSGWTNLFAFTHVLLSKIRPTKKAAALVAMRNDGVRILKWVGHYLALGFEGIFIYTNDNDDASDGLLEALARAGLVTLIRNQATGVESPQAKAFEHSLRLLPELRDYEWVFYADSDEFLRLTRQDDYTIGNVIDRIDKRYGKDGPSAVLYNWKWFVSGNRFGQSSLPLIENFAHSIPHHLPKSLVRLCDVLTMVPLHLPICMARCFYVDSTLEIIEESRTADKGDTWRWKTIRYEGGQINHYWNKSFEEYAIKKRRGDTIAADAYDYKFDRFFDWNQSETSDNHDPCDEVILGRLYRQLFHLRLVPGVLEAEATVKAAHDRLLDPYGGQEGLRRIYASFLPAVFDRDLTHGDS